MVTAVAIALQRSGVRFPSAPPAPRAVDPGDRRAWGSRSGPHQSAYDKPPGSSRSLPDPHPLLGRQVHLVAGLDIERLVPGVHVADDPVDPILGRRMLV